MSGRSQEVFNEEQTILRIKKYDDEINHLEEQLEIRQRERSQLQTQLDLYRASIAPIKRLSEDVLVLIFSEMIEDFPREVGRLLFVCRAWYRLVTNQPTLWSRIESIPDGDTRHIEWLTSYVNSAVRYSVNMPLDISLDLNFIGAPWFWDHTARVLMEMRDTGSHSDDEDDGSWYGGVEDWAAAETGASTFPLVVDYARILEQHLESLTGKTGEVASRWRSFRINFEPELFATIGLLPLTFLHHPTPLLERLVIELPWRSTPLYLTNFLPITPRLRSVHWDSVPDMNLATLIPCKSQVTNLQIRDIVPRDDLSYTTLFENLQTLSLHFGTPRTPQLSNYDATPLTYPQLQDLTFFGNIPRSIADRLDAPQLHTLHLLGQGSVPTLLDSSFRGPHLHTLFLYADVPDIVGVCRDKFMARFKNIQEFALVHHQNKVAEDGLREMKRNGLLAPRGFHLPLYERDTNRPKREIFID